jgi:hypothetical protein
MSRAGPTKGTARIWHPYEAGGARFEAEGNRRSDRRTITFAGASRARRAAPPVADQRDDDHDRAQHQRKRGQQCEDRREPQGRTRELDRALKAHERHKQPQSSKLKPCESHALSRHDTQPCRVSGPEAMCRNDIRLNRSLKQPLSCTTGVESAESQSR